MGLKKTRVVYFAWLFLPKSVSVVLRGQCQQCWLHCVVNVNNVGYTALSLSTMLVILRCQCQQCRLYCVVNVNNVRYIALSTSPMSVILRFQCQQCQLFCVVNVKNVVYTELSISTISVILRRRSHQQHWHRVNVVNDYAHIHNLCEVFNLIFC